MSTIYFVTHPDVVIDPAVPVPQWPLSPRGRQRMQAALLQPWVGSIRAVFCSAEAKAREAADILASHLALTPIVLAELGENDRSSTGYLPRSEFETVADAFFAHPADSVRGWERAIDAQRRIIAAIGRVVAMAPDGDVAIVSHGGVGTLLLCHLKGSPISRTKDQPGEGGGNVYSFDPERGLLTCWQRIDSPSGAEV